MTAGTPAALPSLEPGVELRVGWVVAAMFWRAHTPADTPSRCGRCRMPWPCWSVRWADEFLDLTVPPPGGPEMRNRDTEPIPRS
jgi:hypothetical protein